MPKIQLSYTIEAPIEVCFDLARSIDFHKLSTGNTKEEAIGGVTSGLIGLNEFVTWQATHFGVKQKLTSKITELDRPHYFVDEMEEGIFQSIWHRHTFTSIENGTLMTDEFKYISPLGLLGSLADALFLKKYMTELLHKRNQMIKQYAENGKWHDFLPNNPKTQQ